MIGCRVRCKSWIGSQVVTGCFFGKLERFDREFQLCINQLCKTLIDDGLNICDPPHWLLPKALCQQFRSGWLARGNHCFLCKETGQFCFDILWHQTWCGPCVAKVLPVSGSSTVKLYGIWAVALEEGNELTVIDLNHF